MSCGVLLPKPNRLSVSSLTFLQCHREYLWFDQTQPSISHSRPGIPCLAPLMRWRLLLVTAPWSDRLFIRCGSTSTLYVVRTLIFNPKAHTGHCRICLVAAIDSLRTISARSESFATPSCFERHIATSNFPFFEESECISLQHGCWGELIITFWLRPTLL